MQRILILGGTQFVGRAIAEAASSRGLDVTLFHRGQTNPDLFKENAHISHIYGDRNESLDGLIGHSWDAVIDCVAYFPAQVRSAAKVLKESVGVYVLVSTISVYASSKSAITEDSQLLSMPTGEDESVVTPKTYGPLKVQCEQELESDFASRSLIIRAGLQIGAHDHTARFSNWIERIGKRSRVIMPSGEPMPWQQIDALDTANFTLDCLEKGQFGIYNVTGEPTWMPDVLNQVRGQINPRCEFVETTSAEIESVGLEAWKDVALWLPADQRTGFPLHVSIEKALGEGLKFQPLSTSIAEIWDRVKDLDPDRVQRAGLTKEREDAALAALSQIRKA